MHYNVLAVPKAMNYHTNKKSLRIYTHILLAIYIFVTAKLMKKVLKSAFCWAYVRRKFHKAIGSQPNNIALSYQASANVTFS